MTKKHDELVEKVRLAWCEECVLGPERYGYQRDLDMPACEGECEDLCTERARKVVTLILSAFRDGRLDEELGVVGRDHLIGWGSGAEFENNLEIQLEVGDLVIALRKEEE